MNHSHRSIRIDAMTAELRHIEAFLAVARLGHFTRAAAALHVSQSALTVQIRQLEAALGVRLFDRNNRRVALTQAGRELVAPFERISLDVAAVLQHARDLSTHRRGTVTVGALPSVAAGVLPRAIAALARTHEHIVVRVRDAVAARLVELVKAGEVDLGVGCLVRPDPDVTVEPLFSDRLAAFLPAGHPLGRQRTLRFRDLAAHPLILTGHDTSVRQRLERALAEQRLPIQIAQEVTYMSTAIGLVEAGLGIAILPESAFTADLERRVRTLSIREPVLTRDIVILMRTGRSRSPAADQLIATLRATVRAAQPATRATRKPM
jgi:LysR family transcriptional regulator, carnitine catabolism transcriptional activator